MHTVIKVGMAVFLVLAFTVVVAVSIGGAIMLLFGEVIFAGFAGMGVACARGRFKELCLAAATSVFLLYLFAGPSFFGIVSGTFVLTGAAGWLLALGTKDERAYAPTDTWGRPAK